MQEKRIIRNMSTWSTPVREMGTGQGWLNVVINDNKLEISKSHIRLCKAKESLASPCLQISKYDFLYR